MVIKFDEQKTLDEVFTIQHVLKTIAHLKDDYNGCVVDRYYTSGYEAVTIDGTWFPWYRKVVLYINDNYEQKIRKEIEKPYWAR